MRRLHFEYHSCGFLVYMRKVCSYNGGLRIIPYPDRAVIEPKTIDILAPPREITRNKSDQIYNLLLSIDSVDV